MNDEMVNIKQIEAPYSDYLHFQPQKLRGVTHHCNSTNIGMSTNCLVEYCQKTTIIVSRQIFLMQVDNLQISRCHQTSVTIILDQQEQASHTLWRYTAFPRLPYSQECPLQQHEQFTGLSEIRILQSPISHLEQQGFLKKLPSSGLSISDEAGWYNVY